MPATYPSFATPEQYANLTGTPVDPNVQGLLDAASSMIRRYCGWHIAPEVTEDVLADGTGGHIQALPTLHMTALVALAETSRSNTVRVWDPADVEWSISGHMRQHALWTDRMQGVSATITHGWSLDDCGDLAVLCATMTARAVASPFGEKAQTVGSVAVQLSTGPSGSAGGVALYSDQLAQLDAYRLNQRP